MPGAMKLALIERGEMENTSYKFLTNWSVSINVNCFNYKTLITYNFWKICGLWFVAGNWARYSTSYAELY